jgi:hypothetical protein
MKLPSCGGCSYSLYEPSWHIFVEVQLDGKGKFAWFEVFAAAYLRIPFFWDVTLRY